MRLGVDNLLDKDPPVTRGIAGQHGRAELRHHRAALLHRSDGEVLIA